MKLETLPFLTFSLGLSFLAGAVGSIFSIQGISIWYTTLAKPPFVPETWVFVPVWTTLYVLIGLALYLVIIKDHVAKDRKRLAYWYFAVQLVLNILWTLVFFTWHMSWAAVVVSLALVVAIVWTARAFWNVSRFAGSLLLPYLLWVLFATYLTLGIALLN